MKTASSVVTLVAALCFSCACRAGLESPNDLSDVLIDRIHTIVGNPTDVSAAELGSIQESLENVTSDSSLLPVLVELGIAQKWIKQYERSRLCFVQAAEIAKEIDSWFWLSQAYENLSDLSRWQHDYPSAHRYAEVALEYGIMSGDKPTVSEVYYSIGKLYENEKNYIPAFENYEKAIKWGEADLGEAKLGQMRLKLARTAKNLKEFDLCLEHARIAVSLFLKTDKWLELCSCYEVMAHVQIKVGQFDEAVESTSLGLDVIEGKNSFKQEIVLRGYLATIYRKIGYLDKALHFGIEALRTAEETGNANYVATSCLQLAVVHETLGNLEEAPIYLNRVIDLESEITKKKYIASAQKTMSRIHTQKGDLAKALKAAQQSHELYSRIDDVGGIAASLFNIAGIYERMGDLESAISYISASKEHFRASHDRYGVANVLIQLGRMNYGIGNSDAGIAMLKNGIAEAEEISAGTLLMDGYRELFDLLSRSGQLVDAQVVAKKYIQIQETLQNKEVQSRISNLQIVSKIEQKQREINRLRSERIINQLQLERSSQEIELLNGKRDLQELALRESKASRLMWLFSTLLAAALLALLLARYRYLQNIKLALQENNEVIERSNDQLVEVNTSKDQFFTMIAHDLKNSIGNLTSCIRFVNTDNFRPKDEDARELMHSLKRSATESHQLLLNLLQWAKIQMARVEVDELPIKLHEVIEETEAVFENAFLQKELTLDIRVGDEVMVLTDENILKTILRNLVHNAIKFSHRGHVIIIDGASDGDAYVVSVIDHGLGLPEGFEAKVRGKQKFLHGSGTEGEVGSGIGLAVCNWLIGLIDSEIKFESISDGATKVSFRLPLLNSLSAASYQEAETRFFPA